MEKFDGTSFRPLTPPEVKQIAGRAGRFGSRYSCGQVTCLNDVRRSSLVLISHLYLKQLHVPYSIKLCFQPAGECIREHARHVARGRQSITLATEKRPHMGLCYAQGVLHRFQCSLLYLTACIWVLCATPAHSHHCVFIVMNRIHAQADMAYLHACLGAENPALERACLFPRYQQLALFADQHPDLNLPDALEQFADRWRPCPHSSLPFNLKKFVQEMVCCNAQLPISSEHTQSLVAQPNC